MKRSILAFFSLLLLISCSHDNTALVSNSSAEVYIHDKESVILIDIDSASMDHLKEISNLSREELISDLFNADVTLIDDEEYNERRYLYSLFIEESGDQTRLEGIKRYAKDLRKTEFMNTINELSSQFDEKEVKRIMKSSSRREYALALVLSINVRDYDETKDFISLWLEEIKRSI